MHSINNPNVAIMVHLKAVTHQAHRDLEKSACLSRLFGSGYQLQEYVNLLKKFFTGSIKAWSQDCLPICLLHGKAVCAIAKNAIC